jgi:cell division protein FtsI/penicillin-binding protein 2
MSQLRNHALGAEEARFTTLRLAAILGTAGTGKVLRPYLVEAITELDGTVVQAEKDSVRDIDASLKDLTHHRAKMMAGMTEALQKVLLPGGTGSFFIEAKDGKSEARRQYLALDDPDTIFNEARRGHSDYGKSGTADYGKPLKEEPKKLQDSLFVYRHGRYLIAVWLEQADRGGEGEHKAWDRHPAHKLTHRLVQLIEALEYQP